MTIEEVASQLAEHWWIILSIGIAGFICGGLDMDVRIKKWLKK